MTGKNSIMVTVLFLTIALTVQSQTSEIFPFSADRPGVATPPSLMQPRLFQIETGFSKEKIKSEHTFQETTLYNSSLLRYGINRNAEIRIQNDYAKVKTDCTSVSGFNPLTIGSKIFISEQHGILPQTSVLINFIIPKTGKDEFSAESLTPSLYLLMQNNITDKFNVCYNAGLEYDGLGPVPAEFAALCFGYSFSDNLSVFIENYNWFASKTKPQNYCDLGCAYLIGKNIQIDLSGNLSLQDVRNYYMFNFGVAWRIMK